MADFFFSGDLSFSLNLIKIWSMEEERDIAYSRKSSKYCNVCGYYTQQSYSEDEMG